MQVNACPVAGGRPTAVARTLLMDGLVQIDWYLAENVTRGNIDNSNTHCSYTENYSVTVPNAELVQVAGVWIMILLLVSFLPL
jgi:hypothetical protein